jgi:hypothetical protein
VQDGRYGPIENWRAPLSTFKGLQQDFGTISQARRYTASRRVHGLLLVHPDPFKSILLHASHKKIADQTISYYKEQLGVELLK